MKNIEQQFEYVDLGLPSGTMWATCNVGAKEASNYGMYLSFDEAQKYVCPSEEQIDELVHNTTSVWTSDDDFSGRLFVGKNGNMIFLPAAGCIVENHLLNDGLCGEYWTDTPYPNYTNIAYRLYFNSKYVNPNLAHFCNYRFQVRPVRKK